jgi:hypothetical protein
MSFSSDSDGYDDHSPDWSWEEEYSPQLTEVYRKFMSCGEALFGSVFHQLGNIRTFIRYVESSTLITYQPREII